MNRVIIDGRMSQEIQEKTPDFVYNLKYLLVFIPMAILVEIGKIEQTGLTERAWSLIQTYAV